MPRGSRAPEFSAEGFRGGSAGFAGARAYSRSEGVVEPCRGRSFLKSQGVEISARIGLAHPPNRASHCPGQYASDQGATYRRGVVQNLNVKFASRKVVTRPPAARSALPG